MIDYLTRHAIQNVWCTPDQDYQYIFKPARISPPRGAERQLMVEWEYINLPNNVDTFHVYQIGQLSPSLLNLLPRERHWYTLTEASNNQNMVVDLYLKDGRQFPRFESYVLKTRTRNLLLVVKDQQRIGRLDRETLYVRFYSNAFFGSERAQESPIVDRIRVEGKYITTPDSGLLFQRRIRDLQALKGHVNVYHNGWLVDDTPPDMIREGDIVELVHDTSVYDVREFPVAELETFNSKLDGLRKYLISRLKGTGDNTIDYVDDVDVYLVKKTGRHWKGVYFHKNSEAALRMVTHKDYSIPVSHVVGFANEFDEWDDPTELVVRVHVRQSGYHRPLVDEHHRIKELYHLSDDEIYRAMIGADSTVPVWRAENLESSGYTAIMRADFDQINRKLVQDAYGYNAISKLVADTPQLVEDLGGYRGVSLPVGLRNESTAFEYDKDGLLIDFYRHSFGDTYAVKNPQCEMVEVLVGAGSGTLSTVYGERQVPIDERHNYRMYTCPIVGGVPTYEWEDVTGDTNLYTFVNGELVWMVDDTQTYTAVKNDIDFLTYRIRLNSVGGIYRFSVTAREQRGDSFATLPLDIPVGQLSIWMNGHALIENLDYYVQWPEVVIVNKQYLRDDEEQDFVIRGTGFCLPDMTREAPNEAGFVKHGLLSRNRRYDVRDDKVMRFVVGGKTLMRDVLKFSEHDSGLRMDDVPNGTPYVIDDVVVPLRDLVDEDTYSLREKSLEVDEDVSDYLTLKYPEPVIDDPNIIEQRYRVFSPFASKIHHDLLEGILYPDGIKGQYSDAKIKEWLKGYEFLLKYDPVRNKVDDHYVSVHPVDINHVTELDIYQYTFLDRAIQLYLGDRVDISYFVSIKEGWV